MTGNKEIIIERGNVVVAVIDRSNKELNYITLYDLYERAEELNTEEAMDKISAIETALKVNRDFDKVWNSIN